MRCILAHLFADLPICSLNIALVSRQCHQKLILIIIIPHFIDPVVHWAKWLLCSNIIADYCTDCIFIVELDHRPKSFWATCVPDMKSYSFAITESSRMLKVSCPHSNIVHVPVWIAHVPLGYWWFTHSTVSKKHYFTLYNLVILTWSKLVI